MVICAPLPISFSGHPKASDMEGSRVCGGCVGGGGEVWGRA